jgi:RimJ/RimL family protein N-acetyltransferase
MLDKSVEYMGIIMRRDAGTPIPEFDLPEGFKFVLYKGGDEKSWAKIETSVLEFGDELDALLYFQREFVPISETERRCVFIENDRGEKVATASAWHAYSGIRRDPILHWVAVNPNYQGLGLGKAVVSKVMRLMKDIEGDRDFYLHTQTWSHVAIRVYMKSGFYITGEKDLIGSKNDEYPRNIEILKSIGLKI